MKSERHIILFDGVCNLCNKSVSSIIKKDKKGIFKFASLQSEAGAALIKEVGLPAGHSGSFVYIKNYRYFLRSDAALEVAKTLGGIWKFFYIFKIIPGRVGDMAYNLVAKNRYKWFGKRNECMVPTSELRSRFL